MAGSKDDLIKIAKVKAGEPPEVAADEDDDEVIQHDGDPAQIDVDAVNVDEGPGEAEIEIPLPKQDRIPKIKQKSHAKLAGAALVEGRLIANDKAEIIANYFARKEAEKNGIIKISKKDTINEPGLNGKLPYSVIKASDGNLYALYKGKEKSLGEGTYGRVKIAQNIKTGEWVAVKIQKIELDESFNPIKKEAGIEIQHGGGISTAFREVAASGVKGNRGHKPGYKKGYIFQELLAGAPLDAQTIDSTDDKLNVAIMSLMVLDDKFHKKGLIHRDIKGGNIMYDKETNKLSFIDMGLLMNVKDVGEYGYKSVVSGSPSYMSPEIGTAKKIVGKIVTKPPPIIPGKPESRYSQYSFKSDIYAMGVLFREDLKLRMGAPDPNNFFKKSRKKILELIDSMTDGKNPEKRPTASEAIATLREIKRIRLAEQKAAINIIAKKSPVKVVEDLKSKYKYVPSGFGKYFDRLGKSSELEIKKDFELDKIAAIMYKFQIKISKAEKINSVDLLSAIKSLKSIKSVEPNGRSDNARREMIAHLTSLFEIANAVYPSKTVIAATPKSKPVIIPVKATVGSPASPLPPAASIRSVKTAATGIASATQAAPTTPNKPPVSPASLNLGVFATGKPATLPLSMATSLPRTMLISGATKPPALKTCDGFTEQQFHNYRENMSQALSVSIKAEKNFFEIPSHNIKAALIPDGSINVSLPNDLERLKKVFPLTLAAMSKSDMTDLVPNSHNIEILVYMTKEILKKGVKISEFGDKAVKVLATSGYNDNDSFVKQMLIELRKEGFVPEDHPPNNHQISRPGQA